MLIRAKKTMAGPNGVICAGKVGRVSEQQAVFLVGKGVAEYVGEKPEGADVPLLSNMSRAALVELCKEAGVRATGNKDTLIKRLEEQAESADEEETVSTLETTAIR